MKASRRLRILQIVGTDTGGAWFFDQVSSLVDRGYDIVAVVPGNGPLTKRLKDHGIATTVIPFKGFGFQDLMRVGHAQLSLIKLVRRFKPDIIHSHLLKAIIMGRLAGTLGRTPIQISQIPGTVHLDIKWLRLIDRMTLPLDDLVIGSCKAIAARYSALGAKNVAVNYYGCHVHDIDPLTSGDRFRREFAIADGMAMIGMIAHMYPTNAVSYRDIGVKGHEVFIDAAGDLAQIMPNLEFFIVGDELIGNGSYRARLESQARGRGLGDRMHFTGHRDDIPNVIAAMDILVNPSLSESASYSMIEALLMQRGVIATNVGGLPDTIQHNETGLLVEPRDPVALRDAMVYLVNNPTERARMGTEGRVRVLERFDIEHTVDELERIYMNALLGSTHA